MQKVFDQIMKVDDKVANTEMALSDNARSDIGQPFLTPKNAAERSPRP